MTIRQRLEIEPREYFLKFHVKFERTINLPSFEIDYLKCSVFKVSH